MEIIEVTKQEVLPLLYFIVSMFQEENNAHRQGTSSKCDLIGGYIDRWINKIPENILFNKMLLANKAFSVVNDYFVYASGSKKNAPDILGLKSDNRIIKFAEFVNNKWVQIEGMPHIEVKTFRSNQYLVSVRETQLNDDTYYVFAESDFKPDYLTSFFETSFFSLCIAESIVMDECFIRSNTSNVIERAPLVVAPENDIIGSIGLITVIKGIDIRQKASRCISGENIYYVKEIARKSRVTAPSIIKPLSEMFSYNAGNGSYEGLWNGKQLIPLACTNPNNINIVKINQNSFYVCTCGPCSIYDTEMNTDEIYCITIGEFDRSSKWTEYVGLKNQFSGRVDRTGELIERLDSLYEKKNAI